MPKMYIVYVIECLGKDMKYAVSVKLKSVQINILNYTGLDGIIRESQEQCIYIYVCVYIWKGHA